MAGNMGAGARRAGCEGGHPPATPVGAKVFEGEDHEGRGRVRMRPGGLAHLASL